MNSQNNNEDIKQCVLIAEPFGSNLPCNPLFVDFNSASILQFNINWLIQHSVKQCFVLYSNNKLRVEKLLADIEAKEIKITPMYCDPEQTKTIGDVMRELYFHQVLANDFLLVYGHIISNINLKDLWREHLARKQLSSKENILTVALQNSSANECYVLNQSSKQILQTHDFHRKFKLNTERIKISEPISDIRIRSDLSQAGVFGCSLQVIKGFKQTFQHQNLSDFIVGILTSEIYSERIYSYVLKNTQKCIKIEQPYDYYRAYQHLLNRYFYPFLVERPCQLSKSKQQIPMVKYSDYNKYIKTQIPLRGIKISHNTYIGESSRIQQGINIFKTIVSKNCILEKGCNLRYCIVIENTVVPENYKAVNCLLIGSGDSFQSISWQKTIDGKGVQLQTQQLFQQEIEQGQHFEDDLKIILSEIPTIDTYKQLSSLRKQYNKTCREFVCSMIINLRPDSKQSILKIINQWGQMIRKTCQDSDQLLSAVADAFAGRQQFQSKFPYFLMYSYQKQQICDTDIVQWFDSNKNVAQWKLLLEKSNDLVDKMREDDEEEEDDDQS